MAEPNERGLKELVAKYFLPEFNKKIRQITFGI